MKIYRLGLIISGMLVAWPCLSQQKGGKASAPVAVAAPFGVQDVIDMLDAKVSEEVVIRMINKANLRFTLNAKDVVALTKAGASERVLHELDPSIPLSKPADSARAVPPPDPAPPVPVVKPEVKVEADPNDPDAPHTPGIYLYTEKNGERKMVPINKTVPQNSRTKNTPVVSVVKGAYIYAFLPRAKAVVRTAYHQPIFYFYVGETSQINSAVDSPGQVALIKMDPQTMQGMEGRRMAYAKVPHAFSKPIVGTDPKAMRLFKYERTSPRAFRLIPDNELDSGEYCFFFNTSANATWEKGAGWRPSHVVGFRY